MRHDKSGFNAQREYHQVDFQMVRMGIILGEETLQI